MGTTESGKTFVRETYVQVRWPWLASLISQVALSAVFLVAVMVQTAVMEVKVIKSSSLATMFAISAEDKYYLERDIIVGRLGEASRMAQRLKDVTGRFMVMGSRGWVVDLGHRGSPVP